MNATAPQNHKPAERIAVKRFVFGDHVVEFSRRHGSSVKLVASMNYGPHFDSAIDAWRDEINWLEIGTLP